MEKEINSENEHYHMTAGQHDDGCYSAPIRLVARDVDINNKWKLSSVFESVQEVANDQCTVLGCGWKDLMLGCGYCYVIVRMDIVMERYPQSGDTVWIDTWPDNKLRLVFTRYFRLRDEAGNVIGRAASQWVLFDVRERKVVKPQDCDMIHMPDTSKLTPPIVMSKQSFGTFLSDADDVRRYSVTRTPSYSDFDYNGHVNNARYIEWVFDALTDGMNVGERYGRQVRELDIKYEHELDFHAISESEDEYHNVNIECALSSEQGYFTVSARRRTPPDGESRDSEYITHFECRGEFFDEA